MGSFLRYFYQDMGMIFKALLDILLAVFEFFHYLLNFPRRIELIQMYYPEFDAMGMVLLVLSNIALIVLICLLLFGLAKLLHKLFRFHVPVKKYDELVRQVQSLQRDLIRANYEKDRILALKVAELGLKPDQVDKLSEAMFTEAEGEQEEKQEEFVPEVRNTVDSPCVDPLESRFFRLTEVDNYYKLNKTVPEYDNSITLEAFCDQFRLFAASQLKLYYNTRLIRHFIASLGTARIVILQGISGTGKTSLPYAFGKFVQKDTTVVSVQPAWRERTELYGYFNEFTKRYTETDFLKAVYEANYYRTPHMIILDEMNIARVEYYFAEMLSILEMPLESEWKIDVVSSSWDNDPCLIDHGKINIPNNIWFIGTINNDDSTFAVADKVYDRAIPIDLDSRAEAFECEMTPNIQISTDHLNAMFAEAKEKYPISQDMLDKLEKVNTYLINTFRLSFGNRIMKQLRDYVPCYIACGGTEIEAVDFMVAKKVLRKFESLSLGFMKEELTRFQDYLDKTFGKNQMEICKDYIDQLKKNN
ncbi:MAG: hypothetical protein E7192_00370 [Erysipelotrichaceae bacterium]|nr:hypothetical protein [Erysipelotrichaceae bacterium]